MTDTTPVGESTAVEEPLVLVLYGADREGEGEVDMDFDGGENYSGRCIFLGCKVVNPDTLVKSEMMLVVPTSVGPALLAALLTEEQWEAVCNA